MNASIVHAHHFYAIYSIYTWGELSTCGEENKNQNQKNMLEPLENVFMPVAYGSVIAPHYGRTDRETGSRSERERARTRKRDGK